MNARSHLHLVGAAIVVGLTAACSDSPGPPTPGIVAVSLVTPDLFDGAILFALTGPGVSDVKPASSAYVAYWRVVSPTEARVIVLGDLSSGVLATFGVADVSQLDQYSAQVLEVASRGDGVRSSVIGYALKLAVSK